MNKITFALVFVVLFCGAGFAIGNATATYAGSSKYNGTSAGSMVMEGGNITGISVATNTSTEKWAGMYGNVSGQIVLARAGTSPYMYSWTWSAANTGEVCASTNSAPVWTALAAATRAAIDSAWAFTTTDADSATSTLSDASGYVNVNTQGVTGAAAYTRNTTDATAWQTVAIAGLGGSTKAPYGFCVNVSSVKSNFAGESVNFQLIVPTNQTDATYETYYFYVELV